MMQHSKNVELWYDKSLQLSPEFLGLLLNKKSTLQKHRDIFKG